MDAAPTTPPDESPLREQHRSKQGRQSAVTDAVFTTRQVEPLVCQLHSHELGYQPVVADTVLATSCCLTSHVLAS